jgi:hypothetical protein
METPPKAKKKGRFSMKEDDICLGGGKGRFKKKGEQDSYD